MTKTEELLVLAQDLRRSNYEDGSTCTVSRDVRDKAAAALREYAATMDAPEHVHEWFRMGHFKPGQVRCMGCGVFSEQTDYTHPPAPTTPLTDADLWRIWNCAVGAPNHETFKGCCRAVLAAQEAKK